MKFPNHILLDWHSSYPTSSSQYWFLKFLFNNNLNKDHIFFFNFIIKKKINLEKNSLNELLKTPNKYTLKHNKTIYDFNNNKKNINLLKNFFSTETQNTSKKKTRLISSFEKIICNYTIHDKKPFSKFNIKNFFNNFFIKNKSLFFENNNLWSLFDVYFLKKEKIYTKLKYSRVPQYDIVSGGVAALFAGFLGFLICEKFGFELLDSGDFYILFMYLVFISFFLRLFMNLFTHNSYSWSNFSLKWFFLFYQNLIFLIFNFIKNLYK